MNEREKDGSGLQGSAAGKVQLSKKSGTTLLAKGEKSKRPTWTGSWKGFLTSDIR